MLNPDEAKYYQSKTLIELGTSLGITTSYLALSGANSTVYTLEGSRNIAAIAIDNFDKNHLKNIQLIQGNFEKTIPPLVAKIESVDLLFVDGNHRKQPTIEYFKTFLKKSNNQSIFIFDDIHWSKEMEEAWEVIKQHDSVTLSIDLFFIGLVFFSHDFKVKQHFTIRF